ncbi:putative bifunctional diguanylate cyclase/phosphodiesterase [Mariluticola halotolerans]|uniref:putative bifunctional diguanylate cyclase/phosphodiesterase n=1 Tax=Mariluticola halotolerans TaxID=2909283 RepID=UPI0026E37EA4|nr:EAL domain-containing protein [Mariluticola halotolerans]UJQ93219.1 EAL domain-containing protein [Mariluticola halotolerans]
MTEPEIAPTQGAAFAKELDDACLQSAMRGVPLAIFSSCAVALSAAAIIWLNQKDQAVFWWLAALIGTNLGRYFSLRFTQARPAIVRKTKLMIGLMIGGALVAGLCWASVPLFLVDITQGGYSGYVVFILAGISAGSAIQSTGIAWNAIAFFLPPNLAMMLIMLATGAPTQTILGLNIALLTYMLLRSTRAAEKNFRESKMAALQATSLAKSLSRANIKIRESNTQLAVLANEDPLTGLANRSLFARRLEMLVSDHAGKNTKVALLALDIDLFKSINDTWGHLAGDNVLKSFADRLRRATGQHDVVARLGGDEFAVIIAGPDADRRALEVAETLMDLNLMPMQTFDAQPLIGCSIGIAHFPTHAQTANDLFTSADIALYEAKAKGRRCHHVFDQSLKDRIDRRLQIETQLASAIASGDITAHFQPQIELGTGKISGFETLVRWTHPQLGPISPPEIVTAARVMGLSEQLTGLMAVAACGMVKQLDASGHTDTMVAINISPSEFKSYSPAAMFSAIAKAQGVRPERLEIEITEEALLDTDAARADLQALESAGFALAVDDFGMGHSSLVYLLRLKIHRLKIDRSFVDGIAKSAANRALLTALVSVGRSLSVDIVAEGVETEADAKVVRKLGCRHGQGYYYGRPMPQKDAADWMAHWDDNTPRKIASRA